MHAKNILVLTNIYPAIDLEKENTPVVHYFTREWVKMGYGVRVIHYPANFPKLVMALSSFVRKQLSSRLGATIRTKQASDTFFLLDNVPVRRIPLIKHRPHGAFNQEQLDKALEATLSFLDSEHFVPDVIVSHWVNPQLLIMRKLKQIYGVPVCYIAHTALSELNNLFSKPEAQGIINEFDLIGFRSEYIKKSFLNSFDYSGPSFQCYSGIPESYLPATPPRRSFSTLDSIVFVGTLIRRKYPAEIVKAACDAYGEEDFRITYIGTGEEEKRIKRFARERKVSDRIRLLGYQSRDEVVNQLRSNDIFIMISRSEAFGLVYLEAMAQGCITIASRGEGFDGIIQHGVNGFLCNPGDVDELGHVLGKIRTMPKEDLERISENAYQTAKTLTDYKAAQNYLRSLESTIK